MDLMIAFVTIGLIGYALYYVFTEQDGGSCLAAQSFKGSIAAAAPKPEVVSPVLRETPSAAVPVEAAVKAAPVEAAPVLPQKPVARVAPIIPARPAAGELALRHPVTGETATVPANYRFAKKWVKEALVAEGLLEKVYKNNELDEATSLKIKAALEQFKTLAKYHA